MRKHTKADIHIEIPCARPLSERLAAASLTRRRTRLSGQNLSFRLCELHSSTLHLQQIVVNCTETFRRFDYCRTGHAPPSIENRDFRENHNLPPECIVFSLYCRRVVDRKYCVSFVAKTARYLLTDAVCRIFALEFRGYHDKICEQYF